LCLFSCYKSNVLTLHMSSSLTNGRQLNFN
jgi:hypothetical protein